MNKRGPALPERTRAARQSARAALVIFQTKTRILDLSSMSHATSFKIVGILIGIAAFTWILFGFFGVQALFMNKTVNETVPIVTTSTHNVPNTNTSTTPTIPTTINPVETTTGPQLIGQGNFQQGDSTYTISGLAMITKQDGQRTLSLTDFSVTNGPDLFVYLVTADNADNQTIKTAVGQKQFFNLGVLKGNRGNQTYSIPSDIPLSEQTMITIWCRRFARHFGTAKLTLSQP